MTNYSFDDIYCLNNLDKVLYYIKQLPTGHESGLETMIKKIKSSCSRNFNYFFGDKHWYDEKIAQRVVQYYVWESRFDPTTDSQIFKE